MFTQTFIKIFHSVQEIGLFSLFENLNSATPRPIPNGIWQSFGLHLVNINAYAKFYQKILNRLVLLTFFTKRSVTKSSQTVQWQNQVYDYRALYESQPSVSVDFLRVVQLYTSGFSVSKPPVQQHPAAVVAPVNEVASAGAFWVVHTPWHIQTI